MNHLKINSLEIFFICHITSWFEIGNEKYIFSISSKYFYFKPIYNYTRKGLWKGTLICWNCDTLVCFCSWIVLAIFYILTSLLITSICKLSNCCFAKFTIICNLFALGSNINYWVKPHNTTRLSMFILIKYDDQLWIQNFKMSKETLFDIVNKFKPLIVKFIQGNGLLSLLKIGWLVLFTNFSMVQMYSHIMNCLQLTNPLLGTSMVRWYIFNILKSSYLTLFKIPTK